jgi:hypothetical protein
MHACTQCGVYQWLLVARGCIYLCLLLGSGSTFLEAALQLLPGFSVIVQVWLEDSQYVLGPRFAS